MCCRINPSLKPLHVPLDSSDNSGGSSKVAIKPFANRTPYKSSWFGRSVARCHALWHLISVYFNSYLCARHTAGTRRRKCAFRDQHAANLNDPPWHPTSISHMECFRHRSLQMGALATNISDKFGFVIPPEAAPLGMLSRCERELGGRGLHLENAPSHMKKTGYRRTTLLSPLDQLFSAFRQPSPTLISHCHAICLLGLSIASKWRNCVAFTATLKLPVNAISFVR